MKLTSLITATFAGAIALSSSISLHQPAQAQSTPGQPTQGFYCDSSSSVPMTIYINRETGKPEIWIRWASNYFSNSGYDNLTRCQNVSRNLEIFRLGEKLNFIKIGRKNNQNILCASIEKTGKCDGIIYTLKHNQDPIKILDHFMRLRAGKANNIPLEESGSLPVVDMRKKIYGSNYGNNPINRSNFNNPRNTPRSTPNNQVNTLREL